MKEEIETTIGAIIINNREYLKKDIADCANDLNIPIEYLDAVERDFFSIMPSKDYSLNCIKKYIKYLNINGDDLVKINSLIDQYFYQLNKSNAAIYRIFRVFYLLLRYSIFSILIIISISIFLSEESYKKIFLSQFYNLESIYNKINLNQDDKILKYEIDTKVIDQPEDVILDEDNDKKIGNKIIQLEAKDSLWIEIIDHNSKILISKNFRQGDRYFFTFNDGDVLLTNNPSNLLIKYDNILINTISNNDEDIIEIDLRKILN
jgi:hypothetical protein|tara:strand:+ start:558 stop:1346 length:789 start_codon:yes stop_codon:yes gene_type:complete